MGRNTITLIFILLISAGILGGCSYSPKSGVKDASQSKMTSDSASITPQAQPEPKSLRVIMAMMLASMQQFDLGLYNENYELMANEAGNIAGHAPIKKEDLQLLKQTLGKQMKKFEHLDMQVHHHADSMRLAAQREEMDEILRHYSIVQHGCVSCHANFQSRIRNARVNQENNEG